MDKEVFVSWFRNLSNEDVAIAGGKGASLAEMYNIRLPVPSWICCNCTSLQVFC